MELINIALLLSGVLLAEPEDAGTIPAMRDPNLPAILSVTIKENGATSPAGRDSGESCEKFVLSTSDVREFLREAKEVSQHDYYHMLNWSPCFASGTVQFKGGVTGVWGIQRYRAGSLRLKSGKQYYLFCQRCHAKQLEPAVEGEKRGSPP